MPMTEEPEDRRALSDRDAWQALGDAAERGRLEAFPGEADAYRRLTEASNPAYAEPEELRSPEQIFREAAENG